MSILERINSRQDLLELSDTETEQLCEALRSFLVDHVSQTGGHLASNLGIVELTVAIQKVFDTERDRLVFDVGHQSYVHKILTGRREQFSTLRQFGGISGFPKPVESIHDAFVAGHASNAISVALGMARARSLQQEDYHVIALLGDGAMTGGLAYEGINDAGESGEPLIVILNDNGMSIRPNVGGIAQHLSDIRIRPGYFKIKQLWRAATKWNPIGRWLYRLSVKLKKRLKRSLIGSNLFEDMGFEYLGPADGHDLKKIIYLLQRAKDANRPVVVHLLTKKGKGYAPAEENPDLFHGVGKFDPETGVIPTQTKPGFSDTFGDTVLQLGRENPKVCAVTAAMLNGTGLDRFAKAFPDRTFDVGIAEGHTVSMAGGLAKQGMIPVVAIYSTFLQRAYDMIIQDVAMSHLHVVFAVDRAGLVGNDGETHHGVFDVGFLRQIPGMTVLCPANQAELVAMLRQAVYEIDGPVVVRYPRGGDGRYKEVSQTPILRQGNDITVVTYGTMVNQVLDAADLLAQQGIQAEVIKLNEIKPFHDEPVASSVKKTKHLLYVEEANLTGCIGIQTVCSLAESNTGAVMKLHNLGNRFTTHGSMEDLYRSTRLDAQGIAQVAMEVLK